MLHVPALQYEDSDCILLWLSVSFTHRQWCQKLSLADKNCERCEYKCQALSLECSAHPLNMHILLYLRDSVYGNRSYFSISPSLHLLSSLLRNYYSAFIKGEVLLFVGPTSTSIAPGQRTGDLQSGCYSGTQGPCPKIFIALLSYEMLGKAAPVPV